MGLALAALWHDLRQPLTVIQGSAQLLAIRIEAARTDRASLTEAVAMVEEAAGRMTRMLDDLHDLSQTQDGQPALLKRRPTDLVALAHRIVDEQRRLRGNPTITVSSTVAELVGQWDAGQVGRVLVNLLTNALKYSAPTAPVRVRVSGERADWARLEVVDEGIGIPARDLPWVFQPFYRGANAAGQAAGSGIGLASVRAIVDRHGGSVGIASVEGQGTTVTAWLPLSPLPAAEQPSPTGHMDWTSLEEGHSFQREHER
jgi:signal transduction histidine kinase